MRAGSIAVLILFLMLVAAPTVAVTDVDSVALVPGQAPPLPRQGALAQPRSPNQAGFPVDLTASAIPPESPLTPGVIALGEKLFFDPRLSANGTVACATCHDPARAFTDGRP
jgi:cytochrome c peroxidase